MSRKHASKIVPALLAVAIALGIAVPVAAESAGELLEKGIYTEQTVGDLAAAIEIYSRIVDNAEANRPHVARARFRLGMCYLKNGNDALARQALNELIREFPEQEQLVAQAREQLATVQPGLPLGPVPWKDGESLVYRIALPTGKTMGSLYQRAHSTVVEGAPAWQLELRKLVLNTGDNQGVSRVLVDALTQQPISSTVRHGILGNADAVYGPDGVDITGGATDTHVESDGSVYDNEQAMHLLRMLPLEPGFKTRVRFLPTWIAQVVDVDLEVTGRETCQVPAGEFDCYAVHLDLGQDSQKMWFSTGPERYVLRQQAGGVIIELAEIGLSDPGVPVAFGLEDFGFSGSLPPGWVPYEYRVPGRANKAMIRFLDRDSEAISAVEIDRCPGACPGLAETAQRELAGARQRFEAYEMRDGSWTEHTIDGRPAIGFVGDYERDGEPWVQYRIYTLTDDTRFEFILRSPSDRFERLRASFDSVAQSLETE